MFTIDGVLMDRRVMDLDRVLDLVDIKLFSSIAITNIAQHIFHFDQVCSSVGEIEA